MDPTDHQGIRAGNRFGPGLTGGTDRWTKTSEDKGGNAVIPPNIHRRIGAFSEKNDPLPIIAAPKSIFR